MSAIILLFVGVFANSATYSPLTLETKLGIYQLDLQGYHVGYSPLVLNNGFPIGRYAQKNPRSAPLNAGSPTELEKYLRESTEENNRTLDLGAKNREARLQGLNDSESGLSSNVTPTPAAAASMDLPSCMEVALSALKNKASAVALNASLSVELAEMILSENRGSGGLPCGQTDSHLKNVVSSSTIEEIKILSAIAARVGEERTLLLDVTELAFSTDVSAEVRGLYINVWRRLSVAAVFTTSPLPAVDSILSQIEMTVTSEPLVLEGMEGMDFKIVLKKSVMNLASAKADGERFLKEKYGR